MSDKYPVIEGSVQTLGWVAYHQKLPGNGYGFSGYDQDTHLPIIGIGASLCDIIWYDPTTFSDMYCLVEQLTPDMTFPEGSLPQINRILGWLEKMSGCSAKPSLSWNAYFRISREIMGTIKTQEVARLESLTPPRQIPTQIQPWVPSGEYTATPHVGFKIRDVEKGLITLWLYHTDRAKLEQVRQSIESAFGDDHFDLRSNIDAVLNTTNLLVLTMTRKMTPEEIKGNREKWENENPLP